MRSRLPLILIAVALGGLVTFLVYQQMESYKANLARQYRTLLQGLEPVAVIVAAQDIPKAGVVLTEELIGQLELPAKAVQPYVAQDPLEVLGKETAVPLAKGQQILRNQLARPGTGGGALATKIPQEKRAVTIEIDQLTGVSGFIRPDDFVDILWTFTPPAPESARQPVTVTLFQHVQVLAMGSQLVSGGEGAVEARTITLALTPHETELLLFARQQGPMQLSLRPRGDTAQLPLPPATLEVLLQAILPNLQAQTGGAKTVEVIRGQKRELVSIGAPPVTPKAEETIEELAP